MTDTQKPVAYLYHDAADAFSANPITNSTMLVFACDRNPKLRNETPLYAAPQAPTTLSVAKSIAAEQADDPSLWFVATTATEAHLQHALRHLAAAVEGTLVSPAPAQRLSDARIAEILRPLYDSDEAADMALADDIQAIRAIEAALIPQGWACKIVESDFEQNTVTLKMAGDNYQVSAGPYMLVPILPMPPKATP